MFLTDDVKVQIVQFPTILPLETSETPAVTQPTEPTTHQHTQTPDQTDSHPPEKSSITSKVRQLKRSFVTKLRAAEM